MAAQTHAQRKSAIEFAQKAAGAAKSSVWKYARESRERARHEHQHPHLH